MIAFAMKMSAVFPHEELNTVLLETSLSPVQEYQTSGTD
jgi:hypothetical protein